jgi:hypothetical protein
MFQLASLLVSAFVAANSPATVGLNVESCDFGEAYAFTTLECQIPFENAGDNPIRIFDVLPDNRADLAETHEITISPKARGYVLVRVSLENASGNTRHTFRYRFSGKFDGEGLATVRGFTLSVLDQPSPEVNFAVVNLDAPLPERVLELNSHNVSEFQIVAVLEKPSWTEVSLLPDRRGVTVRVRPDAAWGLHSDLIKLTLNTPEQGQAWILVKADIHGDVVPSANPLELGLLRTSGRNEARLKLTSRSGKPFILGKLTLEHLDGEAKAFSCEPPSKGCQVIEIAISKKQPIGTLKGNLWIDLPEKKQRLQIPVRGLLVEADFQVKHVERAKFDPTNESAQDSATSAAYAEIDLNKSIKAAVAKAATTVPAGRGPLLKWTVANTKLIHGFQFFRAESEKGPFVLQNRTTFPTAAEDNSSIAYQWRDDSAVSGKTYWYYIGIVNKDGSKQQLTGPQKVVAK